MINQTAHLEVIAGPMFSGKTEELIRLVRSAVIGRKHVQVFKHSIDTRYGTEHKLYSHAGVTFESELVQNSSEILKRLKPDTEMLAIDETQWLGEKLIPIVEQLLEKKIHVIVAGLAMTFDRQPFIPMPQLMTMADKVTILSAVCSICGDDAVFHKRVTLKGPKVSSLTADPGFVSKLDTSVFQARCRNCYNKKP